MVKGSGGAEQLSEALTRFYGDSLRTLLIYGSAAVGGESNSGFTDVNMLVLTTDPDRAPTPDLVSLMREWVALGNPPPLVFSPDEWRASADVFPMEHLDVLEGHRLLFGSLPVGGEVRLSNLRSQLEQEVMGKLLHLRQWRLASPELNEESSAALRGMRRGVLAILRGMIRLHQERPPTGAERVLAEGARLAAFDPDPVALLLTSASPDSRPAAVQLSEFITVLEAQLRHINDFDPGRALYAPGTE